MLVTKILFSPPVEMLVGAAAGYILRGAFLHGPRRAVQPYGTGNGASVADLSGGFPRTASEYAKDPFDPRLTFVCDGQRTRHMSTPLDETYVTEPIDSFVVGSLPPEECEVRDHLVAAALLRSRVSASSFWRSQLFGKTASYRASEHAFARLEGLCTRSRAHRAAFLRLATGDVLPAYVRADLKRMVDRADRRSEAGGKTVAVLE